MRSEAVAARASCSSFVSAENIGMALISSMGVTRGRCAVSSVGSAVIEIEEEGMASSNPVDFAWR
ncbi:exported hypothetical protein [Mesorhizobium sp. STM 4661]|nr:exported hypothetical protein [Mesorhizobium sp. STM 4661]